MHDYEYLDDSMWLDTFPEMVFAIFSSASNVMTAAATCKQAPIVAPLYRHAMLKGREWLANPNRGV